MPFETAVQIAADCVLATTPPGPSRQTVVIDPLVDGSTGEQSSATQSVQARILELGRARYPQFDFQPFSAQAVSRDPLVMVGTFTPVNFASQAAMPRDAFRFCLVMGDLRSGKAVAKEVTRAQSSRVDITPTIFFRDSPAWTDDNLPRAEYIKSRLEGEAPVLRGRLIASGAGSRDYLVGTGRDDATDALDRRVEFKVIDRCA